MVRVQVLHGWIVEGEEEKGVGPECRDGWYIEKFKRGAKVGEEKPRFYRFPPGDVYLVMQ